MKKIRVAIVGAAGYAGEELLRILTRHPQVEIKIITSRQNAGKDIAEVFPRLNHVQPFHFPESAFPLPCVQAVRTRFPGPP